MTDRGAITAVRFVQPVDLRCLSCTIGETREVVLADPSERHNGGQTDIVLKPHPLGIEVALNYERKSPCAPCYPRGRGPGPACETTIFGFVVYRQCFGIVRVVDEQEGGRCTITTGAEFRRVRPCVSGRASLEEVPR